MRIAAMAARQIDLTRPVAAVEKKRRKGSARGCLALSCLPAGLAGPLLLSSRGRRNQRTPATALRNGITRAWHFARREKGLVNCLWLASRFVLLISFKKKRFVLRICILQSRRTASAQARSPFALRCLLAQVILTESRSTVCGGLLAWPGRLSFRAVFGMNEKTDWSRLHINFEKKNPSAV